MRVAAIYDIHGNLPALEAVLDEIRREGVDRVVVGGDVHPGPMPVETLDTLFDLDLPTECIYGNGDRAVLEVMAGGEPADVPEQFRPPIRWVAEQLDSRARGRMAQWPLTRRIEIPDVGSVLFCHATPANDLDIFTRLTPEDALLPHFDGVDADLVVCGHTHMQFDRMVGGTRVVNAGSVGMPFAEPGAYWLRLGPGVELRRTSFDLEAAATRIRATSYPDADAFARGNVIRPPSEAEMLTIFTGAGIGGRRE